MRNLLPSTLLDNLNSLSKELPIAGLMRHAERYAIPQGEFGNEVELTEKGTASCIALADVLDNRLIQLYSSPVKRCLQTAELLQSKAKYLPVQQSQLLGDPGVFITDREQAHSYFMEFQPLTVVERLLNKYDRNPAGFCYSTKATVYALIQFLLINSKEPGLSLFITHDSILSVVIGIIFNETSIQALWPTYLESLFFWQYKSYLHITYRNQYKNILWIN